VYSIQLYVIKIASDMRQIVGFSEYSINKTDRDNITEIFLKVALNTMTQTLTT